MDHPEHVQPFVEDNSSIRAALECAHIPTLMVTLAHITGDLSILRGDIRPEMTFLGDENGGITPEQQASVREQAALVLADYRDHPSTFTVPDHGTIGEMVNFLTGRELSGDYSQFLQAELALDGTDAYAQPEILKVPGSTRSRFKVLVIGAGMSGLLSGIRLKEGGVDFEILEKNADVGGTWFENTYPGCRVDSPNHVYSYSFQPSDWPQHFSNQTVLQQYFADCANEHGLRPHIRFDTEVVEARFEEATGLWRVEVCKGGQTEVLTANAIISAVGQLNRPKYPDVEGFGSFAGPAFHSARWQHDVDLTGKRVGVIGSGASAFQFVPIIARDAAHVTIFQRTPPWVVPNPEYFSEVPDGKHWLLNHVPMYAKWFRFSMFWRSAEGLLGAVTAEDGWNHPEQSVSEQNQEFRDLLISNLQAHLDERPDLVEKCTPNYPPGAKRALIDDGTWLTSLKRDNVTLLTDPMAEFTPKGVTTRDGTRHEFDVLIYATGFQASEFLHPMKIYGRNGKELHESWDGEPRAFKGISIPGFPNLFCCYGPNTNIVVNGSIVFFSECEVRYILGCLAILMQKMTNQSSPAMDVLTDVHEAYNQRIDDGNERMAWGQSNVSTWYKNKSGRITQNWPFTLLEFWQQTREPDVADYEFL